MPLLLKDGRPRSIRERLDALEWVRREIFRMSAPDQIRQRIGEDRVRALCAALLRGTEKVSISSEVPGDRNSRAK